MHGARVCCGSRAGVKYSGTSHSVDGEGRARCGHAPQFCFRLVADICAVDKQLGQRCVREGIAYRDPALVVAVAAVVIDFEVQALQRRVDLQSGGQRFGALVTDAAGAEQKRGQRRVDLEGPGDRDAALVADIVGKESEHLQRRIDLQGLGDRGCTLAADGIARQIQGLQ
eukprot:7386458-Prymnesium_polylepis.2